MDNYYRPPGGEPRESQPTEQFWHGPGGPGARQGYGDPGDGDPRYGDPGYRPGWQQPGLHAHLARDRRTALRWTVGVTAAVLLAAGGVIAGVSLTGNSMPSTPVASTGSTGTGSTGTGSTGTGTGSTAGTTGASSQAALLNATLSAASLPTAASAPGAGAAGPAARRCLRAAAAARGAQVTGHRQLARTATAARCGLLRRRVLRFFLLRGVDGQFTFRTRSGALKTIAYERGVIQSVASGTSIVVKAADGTTWTWDLVSSTVVRDRSGKISQSSLSAGEPVWVGGPVVSGARDARLIFVRPPSAAS